MNKVVLIGRITKDLELRKTKMKSSFFCVELKKDALNFNVLPLSYIKPEGSTLNAQLSVPA